MIVMIGVIRVIRVIRVMTVMKEIVIIERIERIKRIKEDHNAEIYNGKIIRQIGIIKERNNKVKKEDQVNNEMKIVMKDQIVKKMIENILNMKEIMHL